ncbi:MAG TPA: RidA family protein [Candidatus Limnocylindria bacterium]|nr:RidA family protein [Candidatus Limnocylindria bacterium]
MSHRTAVQTDAAPGAIGPYSQAMVSGGLVFTSGQIGLDPASGELVPGDAADQARQALRNVAAVLDAAGSGWDRVVKVTIFLADLGDFAAVNEAYATFLAAPFPARSTVAVRALPRAALVEIETVALAGEG